MVTLPITTLDGRAGSALAAGECRLRYGTGWRRLVRYLVHLPAPGSTSVELSITPGPGGGGDVWARRFGGRGLVTTVEVEGRDFVERFGPVVLRFRVVAGPEGADLELTD